MTANRAKTWIVRHYDKLAAAVVLLALVGALFMLAVNAQLLKKRQAEFDASLRSLTPVHGIAEAVDRSVFRASVRSLSDPFQIGDWPLRLMVPELRVRCVNCERPIPFAATNCFFCKTAQLAENTPDLFKEWLEKNSLNPLEPDIGNADTDHDGFSNREEFEFHTDPHDPNSHPPALAKINVVSIQPISFTLVFKSVNKLSDKLLFQINLRSNGRTWWKSLGDEVEGFKLVDFDEKSPDGPVLTLQRGEKKIPLIKGKVVPRNEYEVVLHSRLDGMDLPPVRVDADFDVKGTKYRVKKVDTEGMRVLIHDPSRDMDVWIGRQLPEVQPAH